MGTPLVVLIGSDTSNPLYKLEYIKSHIKSFSGVLTSALTGDELAIDRIEFTINLDKYYRTLYSPTNAANAVYQDTDDKLYAVREEPSSLARSLLSLAYATPVRYYLNDTLLGKFYSAEVERISYTEVRITAVSALGILDKQRHLGGLYTGESMSTVLADVINGVVPYTVASDVASIKVYGWLPIETRREALHQLLFAHGFNIEKNANGDIRFAFLEQTSPQQIPEERAFDSGRTSHEPPATKVEVVEHSYFALASDPVITLFDNTDSSVPAGGTFVAFEQAPVYAVSASSGLTVHESGVNYAIVSGVGVLTGKEYNHQTNRFTRDNSEGGAVEKIVASEGCTLVSLLNSSNVSRRLLSYHKSPQHITMDVDVLTEKPGMQVQILSPFRDTVTAFLESMEFSITGFMRSRCGMIVDYEPTKPGGGDYQHRQLLSASGNYTLPADDCTLILVSGGDGGGGGYDGTAGAKGADATARGVSSGEVNAAGGAGGSGGAGGAGGAGGKVFQVRIEGKDGEAMRVTVGAGGTGGARNGGTGGAGGTTTVSVGGLTYSSASGAASPDGYYDIIGQRVVGGRGSTGAAGGSGGTGANGKNVGAASGGAVGAASGGAIGSYRTGTAGSRWNYKKPDAGGDWDVDGEWVPIADGTTITAYRIDYWYSKGGHVDHTPYDCVVGSEDVGVNVGTGKWTATQAESSIAWAVRSGWVYVMPGGLVDSSDVTRGYRLTVYITRNIWDPSTHSAKLHMKTAEIWSKRYELTSGTGYRQAYGSGGGGGAASGKTGGNANYNTGGTGANAPAPAQSANPGAGGNGGSGGGGGGGGGGGLARVNSTYSVDQTVTTPGGAGGAGGLGSAGGAGATGCVLIYY